MKKAAFLDRDGVINKKLPEGQYVTKWQDFEFLPGAANALGLLADAGFQLLIVSNQRGVAKGLMTLQNLQAIHERMCKELATAGVVISGGYYCPHDLHPACACRKPAPGLLLQAAREHGVQLADSWLVGDSETDIEAGKRAGCRTARILAGSELENTRADVMAKSLVLAVQRILELDLPAERATL